MPPRPSLAHRGVGAVELSGESFDPARVGAYGLRRAPEATDSGDAPASRLLVNALESLLHPMQIEWSVRLLTDAVTSRVAKSPTNAFSLVIDRCAPIDRL